MVHYLQPMPASCSIPSFSTVPCTLQSPTPYQLPPYTAHLIATHASILLCTIFLDSIRYITEYQVLSIATLHGTFTCNTRQHLDIYHISLLYQVHYRVQSHGTFTCNTRQQHLALYYTPEYFSTIPGSITNTKP